MFTQGYDVDNELKGKGGKEENTGFRLEVIAIIQAEGDNGLELGVDNGQILNRQ
jgi:hypothetical protein